MIPLFAPHIPEKAGEAVKQLLNSGRINRGPKAEEFEKEFGQMFGCIHALSVNSGTSALRLALEIAIERNRPLAIPEVITTPYTMVATNMAILDAGCIPVFADVDYGTGNLNPDDIARRITPNTVAVMGVEYGGYPCDWQRIIDNINKKHGEYKITLISDSAHALGVAHHRLPLLEFVHMQCFSFQVVKHITTGDGGMLTTNNRDMDALARKLAWFGINKGSRIVDELGARPIDVNMTGFKSVMNDINAVIGLEGLKDYPTTSTRRIGIAYRYGTELADVKGLTLMNYNHTENQHACWLFPMHVVNRSKFARLMRAKGIEVAVHNWRNDDYTVFGADLEREPLPNTEKLNNDLIHIPLHAELTNEEVDYIINTIKELNWT